MATHIIGFPGADIHTTKIKSSSGEFTSDGNLSLLTNNGGTTNLTATSGGNVGINKTVPAFTLDVNGDLNFAGTLYQGGVAYAGSSPWTTTGSDIYYTTGNVGIGTASPQYQLDVDGGTTEGAGDVMLRLMGAVNRTGKLILGRSGNSDIRSHAIEVNNNSGGANNFMKFLVHDGGSSSPYETRTEVMTLLGSGNVGIGTASPIAALDIVGGAEDDTTPALSIRGGIYDTSDLYVLNTYNTTTGVGYAAKVIGVNIKNKVETDNTIQVRNNTGGLTAAGAIYLGSDDNNQGIFGVLGADGIAGTTLTERLTVRAGGNVGIGTASPSAPLHVAGGTIINSDGVAKKTYSYSGDLTSGQTVANSTIKITFSAHVFYAKIVAHLVESDNEVSTFSLECGGGNWSGGTPLAIAKGPQAIFGSASTNPWSSTVTTSATTVSIKPTTNMAVAGHYNVFIEYISQSSSGVVSKITEGATDVVTFGY
jgi:hypothetical protein